MITGAKAKAITYGTGNTKQYITIHTTDNTNKGADADAHARLQFNGNTRDASWHYQVDDKGAYQSFAHGYKCWHSGDGNGNSIAVEICVNSDGNYSKAVQNAIELVKQIMREEGIPVSRVVQHNKWTGKHCPRTIREGKDGWTWGKFIKALSPSTTVSKPSTPKPPASKPQAPTTSNYTVKKGDTLSAIAKAHGTTVDVLRQLNRITNINKLEIGQVLKVEQERYYTKVSKIQVIKPFYLYGSVEFKNSDRSHLAKVGEVYTIVSVTRTKAGTPRLKTKSGFYITANKDYVKKIK